MSSCFFCKSTLEDKLVNHIVDQSNTIIIGKDVPAEICTHFGETSYSDNIAKHLEVIVNSMRDQRIEIAVSRYVEDAA